MNILQANACRKSLNTRNLHAGNRGVPPPAKSAYDETDAKVARMAAASKDCMRMISP
jgi:hypothetical protein